MPHHATLLEQALRLRLEAADAMALEPVDVAVIDSGIDATHPDLAGRVVRACRFEETGGRFRPVEMSVAENNDSFGHGTGVASIIARFAPHARLIDLRVLDARNKGSGEALVAALRLAVWEGWRVINMSLASPARFAAEMLPLCERAYYKNQVIVAARRNVPISDEGFPAEFTTCIGVDTRRFDSPFQFRFRDDHVIEMQAMGEDVPAAAPNGGYTRLTGTSFATPMVSALCARLLGAYPALRPFELRSVLRAQALQG
jgi:subtilisin family serine protease